MVGLTVAVAVGRLSVVAGAVGVITGGSVDGVTDGGVETDSIADGVCGVSGPLQAKAIRRQKARGLSR